MLSDDLTTDAAALDAPPEAPAPDAPAISDGDHADPAADGQPRDASGRFASRTTDDDAPAPTDAAADPGAGPTDGNAPSDPDAPAAQPEPPAATPTATVPEPAASPPVPSGPFTFRHRGQVFEVPGLTVAPEHAPRIQQLLAAGREAETVGRQREAEYRQKVATLEAETQARHAGIEAMASIVQHQDDEEAVAAFLHLRSQWPQMQHQAEKARLEAELAALRGQRGQPQTPQADDVAPVVEALEAKITGDVPLLKGADAAFADWTDAELSQLAPALLQAAQYYVVAATPEHVMEYGGEVGAPFIDPARFIAEAKRLGHETIQQKQQAQRAARQRAAAAQAAKQNAARTAPVNAPPASAPTVTATGDSGDRPQTREEYLRLKQKVFGG
jgi:hypothetical protein